MKAEQLLIELGIYPSLRGFKYICEALEMLKSGEYQVTELYRKIGEHHNSPDYTVERNIRCALSKINYEKPIAVKYLSECPRTNRTLLYMLDHLLKSENSMA